MPATCPDCGTNVTKTAKFCGQCGAANGADAPDLTVEEAPKRDVTLLDIPKAQVVLAGGLEVLGLTLLVVIIRKGASLSALEKLNVSLGGRLDNTILWWSSFGLGLTLALAAVAVIMLAMKKAPQTETQI